MISTRTPGPWSVQHDVLRERLEGREAELTKLVEDKQTELEIHHMAEEELRRQ